MVELIAHRGYARRFPENTLVAIAAAVAAGARYVEVDVQITRDGVPVLFHDDDCRRVCGHEGAIDQYDAATVATFSASLPSLFGERFRGNPVARLTDLAAFLGHNPAVTAFVEVKGRAAEVFGAAQAVALIHDALAAVRAQTVLISFAVPVIAAARGCFAQIGLVTSHYRDFAAPAIQALAPDYHFCDWQALPAGPLDPAGAALAVYEVDDADVARDLEARGVRFVETFAVAELAQALGIVS